jgi:hypothetical protein
MQPGLGSDAWNDKAGGLTTLKPASIFLRFHHAEILVYASTNHLYGWSQGAEIWLVTAGKDKLNT